MKKINPFRITKAEGEVLMHLMNIKSLPRKRLGLIPTRYKRHELAIESLKSIKLIEKGDDDILRLNPRHDIEYYSTLLINNKIDPK